MSYKEYTGLKRSKYTPRRWFITCIMNGENPNEKSINSASSASLSKSIAKA